MNSYKLDIDANELKSEKGMLIKNDIFSKTSSKEKIGNVKRIFTYLFDDD